MDNIDLYKNEGMAIFIKGKMIIGIHPDNLENNLLALHEGRAKIDWKVMGKNAGLHFEPTEGKSIVTNE